ECHLGELAPDERVGDGDRVAPRVESEVGARSVLAVEPEEMPLARETDRVGVHHPALDADETALGVQDGLDEAHSGEPGPPHPVEDEAHSDADGCRRREARADGEVAAEEDVESAQFPLDLPSTERGLDLEEDAERIVEPAPRTRTAATRDGCEVDFEH